MKTLGIRVHYSTALCSAPREKVSHCPSLTSQAGPRREFSSSYLRHVAPSTLADQRAVDSESCVIFPEENREPRIGAVRGFPSTSNLAVLLFGCCSCVGLSCTTESLWGEIPPYLAVTVPQCLTWNIPWKEWRNPRSVSLHLQNGNN